MTWGEAHATKVTSSDMNKSRPSPYIHELPLAPQVLVQRLHLLPQRAELLGLPCTGLMSSQLFLQFGLKNLHLGQQR